MKIIIAGDGKVGSTLLRQLSLEKHDLTLIDINRSLLDSELERQDVMTVQGNCASMQVLLDAGVKEAELLITVTGADEVNLLSCMTAHGLNPNLHTIARIRNPEYIEQSHSMRDLFGLSMAVNEEKQAANEIERLLKFPGFLRRDTFAKGAVEIVELRVDSASKLKDVSLVEMYRIIKCHVLVCVVLREGKAIIPGGNFVLQQGDRIFVTAPTSNLAQLLKNLGIVTRRVRDCIVGGGGRISYYLAQSLAQDGIHVRIIEKDMNRCRALAELLPDAAIIHGDFTNRNELENNGLLHCDAFLSLTGIDEINMVASMYAVSQHVPQVITKVGHTDNVLLAGELPVGSLICPRELSGNAVVRYVRAMENQTGAAISVHSIAQGRAEATEFVVDESTLHCNVPLKELKLRPNLLLATISRGGTVEIPGGNSVLMPGDTVVVVTTGQISLQSINDIFA